MILLKPGRNNSTNINAKKSAIKLCTRDSVKNCTISIFREAPVTFRTPTSFALFPDRAVDKFIKLIPAINITRMAIPIKTYI